MDAHLREVNEMLTGNINRMNVTDSKEELEKMYVFASLRLAEIFNQSRGRILRAQIAAKYKKEDPYAKT